MRANTNNAPVVVTATVPASTVPRRLPVLTAVGSMLLQADMVTACERSQTSYLTVLIVNEILRRVCGRAGVRTCALSLSMSGGGVVF